MEFQGSAVRIHHNVALTTLDRLARVVASWVIRNLPTGPAGIVGRSQKTTPPSPGPSTMDNRNRVLRLSLSSLAITSVERCARHATSADANAGRWLFLSDSTSSNSATISPPACPMYLATAARRASRPRPLIRQRDGAGDVRQEHGRVGYRSRVEDFPRVSLRTDIGADRLGGAVMDCDHLLYLHARHTRSAR